MNFRAGTGDGIQALNAKVGPDGCIRVERVTVPAGLFPPEGRNWREWYPDIPVRSAARSLAEIRKLYRRNGGLKALRGALAGQGSRLCDQIRCGEAAARGKDPALLDQITRDRVALGHLLREHAQNPKRIPRDMVMSEINRHTEAMPIYRKLVYKGRRVFIDEGGAASVWQQALTMIGESLKALGRFRICAGCEALFFDASPRGDKNWCHKRACQRKRDALKHKTSRARARGR